MDKHLTAVGVLFIAFGAQGVFIALIVLLAVAAGGLLSGDEIPMGASVVALSIAAPFFLIEALKIVGGIGLLKRQPWARMLVLILSFISLLHIPIGTIYSTYAIWVLMKDDTVRLLAPAADAQ